MIKSLQDMKIQLMNAVVKARQLHKTILFSSVTPIEKFEPLSFFTLGEEKYKGTRFFWREPANHFTICSFGYAHTFFCSMENMTAEQIEQEWKRWNEDAIQYGNRVEGTGALLVGGQVFDSLKPKTTLWKQFADLHYYIPMFVLTRKNTDYYFSLNVVIDPNVSDETIHTITNTINRLQECKQDNHVEKTTILSSTEVHPSEWLSAVHQAIAEINQNHIQKVVLAREMHLQANRFHLPSILNHLSNNEKNGYVFALESQEDCFVGASPERLIRKKGEVILSTCLAGSIPRRKNEQEMEEQSNPLLHDMKNRKEHQYVVDMIRSVLEPVCLQLVVLKEPIIMKLAHIYHLYTPIQGTVHPEISLMNLVSMLHPTPALGGVPRMEALAFIREQEPLDRGLYGAPLGWMDANGNGEFIVAIRSALLKKNEASIFAGCGIVADSVPELEYEETKVKMRPMLTALGGMFDE